MPQVLLEVLQLERSAPPRHAMFEAVGTLSALGYYWDRAVEQKWPLRTKDLARRLRGFGWIAEELRGRLNRHASRPLSVHRV